MTQYYRGKPACPCLVAWLPWYEKELKRIGGIKHSLDIWQLIGGAPQSGGTHTKGGAFDDAQFQRLALWLARQMGADAKWWRRKGWDGRGGMEHGHGVLRGCTHNGPARYQIDAVDDNYNGLGYMGRAARDDGPRPLSGRTWKQGIAWAKARQPKVFKPQTRYVTVETLTPHNHANAVSVVRPGALHYGDPLVIRGTKSVHGTTWGWTAHKLGRKWWIIEGRTSLTKPKPKPVAPAKPEPVAEIVVGAYNLAAQASAQPTSAKVRFPLAIKHMYQSYADVVMAQEVGSNAHLRWFDDALDAADTDLIRVNGGNNWRHILRLEHRSKWIASRTVTLKTGTDGNGSQIAMAVLEFSGVRASFGSIHFDVGATDAVHAKQAEEAWAALKEFSDEFGVFWMNRTIGGDTNDKNGVVNKVMASHQLVPMADDAPNPTHADKKTTSSWNDGWVRGERIDNLYVPAGASISWEQEFDAEASDHHYQHGVRRLYAK